MNVKMLLGALALTILLTGCVATQEPVPFNSTTVPPDAKIGVIIDVVEDPKMSYPGANCLLCLAVASSLSDEISAYSRTLSVDDLKNIHPMLLETLKATGYRPVLIDPSLDFDRIRPIRSRPNNKPEYNFSSHARGHDVDFLLVVQFDFVGVQRNFSNYIPTGDPQAAIIGKTYLVDVKTHNFHWYQPIHIFRSADVEEWYEPPGFPGITNAFYQVVENFRDLTTGTFVAERERQLAAPITGTSPN
jgi:hypothetical protein